MKRILFPVLISAVTVTGCARLADSRINPMNWFSRSQADVTTPTGEIKPLVNANRTTQTVDNRSLLSSVSAMSIDRTPGGAIVRATGLAATQGFYNAQLVLAGVENGVMTLEFRAQSPSDIQISGPAATREITAARALSNDELLGIRTIRVVAATNSRSSRR